MLQLKILSALAISAALGMTEAPALAQDAGSVQLTVSNPTGSKVDIYQSALGGQPQFVQSVDVGQTATISSSPGTTLIFGINQQPFEQYQVTADPAQQLALALDGSTQQAAPAAPPATAPAMAPSAPVAVAAPTAPPVAPPPPTAPPAAMATAPAPAATAPAQAAPAGTVAMLAPYISGTPTPISAAAMAFPPAASMGGAVLASPAMGSQSLGNLAPGQQVSVLQDTGVALNGFDWFQVQFGGSQVGYQWGAYLCGTRQAIPHTFGMCKGIGD